MSKFDNEIIDMYKNGISVKEIIKVLPCSKQTVYNILNKYNIALNDKHGKRNSGVSKEKVYEMYELYLKGKCTREIGEMYGFTKSYICRLFHEQSLSLRNQAQANRKYNLNENFFDCIDTEEKAYFLGLLWADGTNIVNKNCVEIGLQDRDKHILDSMLKSMEASYPIKCKESKYPGGRDIYSVSIFSEHMSSQLNNIGMVPNKSLVLRFPTCIDESLLHHFIRGVFDGDGYISHGNDYTCEIVGTEAFCIKLKEILLKQGIESKIYNTTLRKETSTRRLYIGKKENVIKFLHYIYEGSSLYLYRKYNIALSKYFNVNNTLTA